MANRQSGESDWSKVGPTGVRSELIGRSIGPTNALFLAVAHFLRKEPNTV